MDKYACFNCERTFDEPSSHVEMHGFTYGPGEKFYSCPLCGSEDFIEATYCDICEDPILDDYIKTIRGDVICANCYFTHNAQE